MPDGDLAGRSFAEVLELLEAGRIGHAAAMEFVGARTYHDLVRIMHLNGRRMPGHRDMTVTAETRELLIGITRSRKASRRRPAA